ncbi:hypothetical protein V1478_009108 [Vespula squamosa]|uniref:Uncharacterized protein n=1 Tax=Vespula squamosa TaxID=30214 RepID=A0ABD2AQR7_VESSQ
MEKAMVVVIILLLAMVTTNGLEIKYLRGISLDDAEKQAVVDKGTDLALWDNVNPNLIKRSSFHEDEDKEDYKSFDLEQPSTVIIGETDLTKKYPNVAKSILQRSKYPRLKILLGLSSECNRSTQKCNTQKYRRQIEKRSIPKQPFYVDEPKWVQIELDYEEHLPYHSNNENLFFLTRGKKIFRPKIEEQTFSKANNYEKNLEKLNEEFTEDTRIKRNESKRKEERRKAIVLSIRQLEKLLRNFDRTEEPFILTRGKKLYAQNREYSSLDENLKKETLETRLLEKIKKHSINNRPTYYMTMINKNTSSFLNGMNNMTLSKEQHRLRTKRNFCRDLACSVDDSKKIHWMKNLERAILDSGYVEKRDKYSDIYDIFEEPFVISKSKKKLKSIDQQKSRIVPIDYDESLNSLDTAKQIFQRLIDSKICSTKQCEDITKLIIENDTMMTDRDRRNILDELLRKYDPFYILTELKLDMWLLLSIITARAIIGSPDAESMDSVQQKFEDTNKDINSVGLFAMNPDERKEYDFQKSINKRFVEGSNLWYVLKNNEILPAWLYLPTNKRSLRSSELDFSEETKNPFFSRWDGKRISSFRSKNQRSTRMPFNSWGGKRGYLDDKASFLIMRGSKSFSDKDAHKNFVEYAKRLSNFGRRTPFYSWGGKRNINTGFDINKYINTIPEEETEFYLPKDDATEDAILDGNEKRAAQMKTSRSRIGFNSWGGKRNDIKEFQLPLNNESLRFEDNIDKNMNSTDQLLIPEKKDTNKNHQKSHFEPWGGKRSINEDFMIIPNNYDLHDNNPAKQQQVFFPWGG